MNIHQINNEIVNTQNMIAEAEQFADRLPALYKELGRLNALRQVEGHRIKQEENKTQPAEEEKTMEVNDDGNTDILRSDDADNELSAHRGGTQQVSAE